MSRDCDRWLAMVAGNSRLHWAFFVDDQLTCAWHTPHLNDAQVEALQAQGLQAQSWQGVASEAVVEQLPKTGQPLPLWLAGVVRGQAALWRSYPEVRAVQTAQVPLQDLYPTLGIDRALSLLGAGLTYGWPMLVVDAGTALTFTAGADYRFLGGAILPGLTLQAKALSQGTDALPQIAWGQEDLPQRWATSTVEAIASGILYAQIAVVQDYLTDWWQQFPAGRALLTGGDGPTLLSGFRKTLPETAQQIIYDPNLMFRGLAACRSPIDR